MRQIELTQDKYALVDDEDYDFLAGLKWHAVKRGDNYYVQRTIIVKGVTKYIHMHREIMNPPRWMVVDHINGDALDNTRENLRVCTQGQNACNRKSSKNSASKYLGVSWDSEKRRWRAQIRTNSKAKKLGRFKTELEAAIIYNIAARKYHGEFARPNVLFQPKHPYTHSSPIVVADSKNGVIVY